MFSSENITMCRRETMSSCGLLFPDVWLVYISDFLLLSPSCYICLGADLLILSLFFYRFSIYHQQSPNIRVYVTFPLYSIKQIFPFSNTSHSQALFAIKCLSFSLADDAGFLCSCSSSHNILPDFYFSLWESGVTSQICQGHFDMTSLWHNWLAQG